ncbi:MAG: arginine repressor, partial [Chloroflexi bacterium]
MKQKRQLAILNLVSFKRIQTQQELSEELANLGLETTQATVSRDIQEL